VSGTEQFFFLVVVPAVIVAVIWALASIGGPRAQRRYRPGRAYRFATVWYLANHRDGPASDRPQLTAGESEPAGEAAVPGTTGGASDRW
jgi:hypothetical protein